MAAFWTLTYFWMHRLSFKNSCVGTFLILLIGMGALMGANDERAVLSAREAGVATADTFLRELLAKKLVFRASPISTSVTETPNSARPTFTRSTIWADVLAYGPRPKRQTYFAFRVAQNAEKDVAEIVFFDDSAKGFFIAIPKERFFQSTLGFTFFRESTIAGDGIAGRTRISYWVFSLPGSAQLHATVTLEANVKDIFRPFHVQDSVWRAELQFETVSLTGRLLIEAMKNATDVKLYNELEEAQILRDRAAK